MKTDTNKKFIDSIWVTGYLNEEVVIGRTCIREGLKSVVLITESGAQMLVLFNNIQQLKKLTIIHKAKPIVTSTIQNIKRPEIVDKLIIEALNSINQN